MNIKKNKIAIILPNLNNGGAERSHIYIANEWIKLGFEVIFILIENKGELIHLLSKDIKLIYLNKKRIRKIIFPLARLLYINKFDIIIAPMWPITIITFFSWCLSLKKENYF